MEMVAAAKLRRAQQRVEQAKPYALKLDEMLSHLAAASAGELSHPLFEERPVQKKTLVLMTADRGLCGSFNSNLIRRSDRWLKENREIDNELILFGKKGYEYYQSRHDSIREHFTDWGEEINYLETRKVVDAITGRFLSGDTDQIDLIFTTFVSMGRFEITQLQYLPIPRQELSEEDKERSLNAEYIFEPDPEQIYGKLLPYYTTTKLITALTESFASEQASRMLAMNAATKAAGEMIDNLTLVYNKARQAQITKEILEVVSGAEALKG
jgi:F-type H+-transporting ATPase subunit gamma